MKGSGQVEVSGWGEMSLGGCCMGCGIFRASELEALVDVLLAWDRAKLLKTVSL